MPSRKKTKGKARRAAKETKAKKEEDSQAVVAAANQRQQERPLEVKVQRLLVSPFAPNKCQHGVAHISSSDEEICIEFINAFITAYRSFFQIGGMFHPSNRIYNGKICRRVFFQVGDSCFNPFERRDANDSRWGQS